MHDYEISVPTDSTESEWMVSQVTHARSLHDASVYMARYLTRFRVRSVSHNETFDYGVIHHPNHGYAYPSLKAVICPEKTTL